MTGEHLTITLKSPKGDTPPPKKNSHARRWRRLYSVAFALVLLVLLGASGYVVYVRIAGVLHPGPAAAPTSANPRSAALTGDPQQVIDRVGALMLLPNETPTIAVVSDLSKLQGQLFFANAELGDVVLMYPKTRKAILYSPTLNKIIEVAPITNDTGQ